MRLTTEERKVFHNMLDYSTFRDHLLILWWGIVARGRQRVLMDCLTSGMNWRSAMRNAKEPLPEGNKPRGKEVVIPGKKISTQGSEVEGRAGAA